MEFKTLIYEKADGIATVTFNRPEAMNASNAQSVKELNQVVDLIEEDDEVKAVIMWGGPKVFAAGGDIKYMSEAEPLEAEKFIAKAHAVHDKIEASPKPYVAAIAGLALGGGCELALACDIRIAAEGAVLGLPEINLGIIPGAGGTQRLTRVVGAGWARHLIMTGEMIDVDTAFKIGLVTKVVPADELLENATKLAKTLRNKSQLAMAAAKKCLALSETTDMPTGLAYEQKAWSFLFCTEDQTEGMKAFLEKRKPEYKGR
ncbi:MAG: enoyl-CoA hydratase/isomerase family protein [Syntrophomonadaceae bacterium]|nr:enoyl-CoA hydratase/isomerase family protein [Syntrophomonadaceae bacterium]